MSSFSDRLKALAKNNPQPARRTGPLWKGPEEDGISQSLLGRFLVCRERFRLHVVEGLVPSEGFNHRLEYGNMWHVCEEAHARPSGLQWPNALADYCRDLCRRYPLQQEQVDKWYNVCKVQFPVYVAFWARHKDVVTRTPVFQEKTFSVRYSLPSGRTVLLRGKWDGADITDGGLYLNEHKTKGDIDEQALRRQLTFDLQTMFYLVALDTDQDNSFWRRANKAWRNIPIRGVRYNVVRRPLSGGKGSIVQKKGSKNVKPETKEEYYARLAQYIKDEPETYFMRWKMEVSAADIKRFRNQFLNPILEQLCDWWGWVTSAVRQTKDPSAIWSPNGSGIHWRHPFGVWNPMDEGGHSDVDEYLASGSEVGLTRTDNLFPELT